MYIQEFIALWDKRVTKTDGVVNTGGELFKGHLWEGEEGSKKAVGSGSLRRAQKQYFEAQWEDTLGFIGRVRVRWMHSWMTPSFVTNSYIIHILTSLYTPSNNPL